MEGELIASIVNMRWHDLVDILVVGFVVYQAILLIKGTKAVPMLVGLGLVFVALVLSQRLELSALNWLISTFVSSLIIVIVIIFQPDIRRALTHIGQNVMRGSEEEPVQVLEEVVRAAVALASRKVGALIVLERYVGLNDIIAAGVRLDAAVSRELLLSLFQTATPLHDGAVIIVNDRIAAAKCVLPLSGNFEMIKHLGTRHRAALGLSEENDAVIVVVSEERGRISVAVEGRFMLDLDGVALRQTLFELFQVDKKKNNILKTWWERLRA